MITVQININGNCILARSATRFGKENKGVLQYRTDCGKVIEHDPDKGAVALVHKLLDCIQEQGINK